jgi:hypothetical protein
LESFAVTTITEREHQAIKLTDHTHRNPFRFRPSLSGICTSEPPNASTAWITGMLRHVLTPGEQAFAAYPRLAAVFHDPERFPCHSFLHHILIVNP